MKNLLGLSLAVLMALASPASAQDVAAFLRSADQAIGASRVNSVRFSTTGWMGAVGQNIADGQDWPRSTVKSYEMTIDYPSNSSHEDYVQVQGNYPAQGATRIEGEQRTNVFVSGTDAWTLNAQGQGVAQPAAAELRQFMIRISPHGFIKSALAANDATLMDRYVQSLNRTLKVVSFTVMGKYRVSGEFNEQFMLERLMTRIPNPVLGDMQMEIRYEEWRDTSNGTKFPYLIHGHRGDHLLAPRTGMNWLNLEVKDVAINVANAASPAPANVSNAPMPRANATMQQLAPGVWMVGGGSHNSLAVEFRDYVAVIDGPQNEERSVAVIAAVKRTIAGKPIRYLVNTHHHWDHLGGVRTFAAQGATIVTHQSNKNYYENIVLAPQIRTLNPDQMSMNPFATTGPSPVPLEITGDRHFISDGQRTLFLFHVAGLAHSSDMLMAYLPQERILFHADLYTPPEAGAAPPAAAMVNPSSVTLYNTIRQLNLNVGTHVPAHGQPGSQADFERVVGPAATAAARPAAAGGG